MLSRSRSLLSQAFCRSYPQSGHALTARALNQTTPLFQNSFSLPFRSVHTVTDIKTGHLVLVGPDGVSQGVAEKLAERLNLPLYVGDSTSIPSDRSVVVLTDADGDSDDGGAASSSLADSVVVLLDTEAGSSNYPYDVRVLTDADKSIDAIACKVQDRLNQSQDFKSTRGYTADGDESLFFLDVVRRGLAPDRGLFVASEYQPFEKEEIERLIDLPYQERALRVMERFPLGTLTPLELREMIYRAYSTFSHEDVQPITHLEKNHYLMETFHGPTASFKDLSLQLTPKILTAAMEKTGASQNVGLIVATSGDTGTAALHGWGQEKDVPLIVLYPKDGVSVCQDLQMATQEGSVCVLGVDGDFDFCQTTVKDILNDHALMDEFSSILPNLTLSSANSINWGRFLPQVVFTVSAYCDMIKKGHIALGDEIDVCIPTGNFGNILGAVYARSMGVPIKDLICASNDNNVLSDFITSGAYDLRGRDFRKTVSPSIDILISSNVERFLHLLSGQDSDYINSLFADLADHGHFTVSEELRNKIQAHVQGGWCNESECIRTIKAVFDRTQVMIDPHTAVAKNVADQFSAQEPTSTVPMLISSTAHFGKFPDSMLEALHEPAVERTDNIQADVATMFSNLSALEPKNSHHPELVHLLEKPVLHDNAVPADKTVIINTIKNFLTDFAAKNAQ